MREELLQELEREYEQVRAANEREEIRRKEQIRTQEPEIHSLLTEREELVFGTLRNILKGQDGARDLTGRMEAANTRIREKLKEKGYPEDYLAPIYRCPACRDTGKTGDPVRVPCECFKKAYQRKLRETIGLKADGQESFEHFNLNLFSDEPMPGEPCSQRTLMEIFRDDCREWADTYPENRCRDLLLNGKSGLGKTFLLHAMAQRLIERDKNVLVISAYRMLDMLRKSYFDSGFSADELMDADVLMIDDLGSEPLMQNVTVEQLFNLLNERQRRGLSTVISTNLDMATFRERYTERIASRLSDSRNCMVMTLKGKDIRTGGGLG